MVIQLYGLFFKTETERSAFRLACMLIGFVFGATDMLRIGNED